MTVVACLLTPSASSMLGKKWGGGGGGTRGLNTRKVKKRIVSIQIDSGGL